MNGLIKVDVNERQEQIVSARELHGKLGISKRFSAWFSDQVNRMSLIENFDYTPYLQVHPQNLQEMKDYHITLEIAKHLAMMSGGEKAHQVRQYFIEVEKAWNSPEQVMARALQVSNQVLLEYKQQIEVMQPKADFYDDVVDSKDAIDMGQVAKVLNMGMGRNKLFEFLRDEKILRQNNEPFQLYVDKGWFRLVESKYQKPNGDTCINIKTVVLQKGVDGIRKMVRRHLSQNSTS